MTPYIPILAKMLIYLVENGLFRNLPELPIRREGKPMILPFFRG
jgi:hypothetical protein